MSPKIARPRAVLGAIAASALAVSGIVATAAGSTAAPDPGVSIRGAGSSTAIPGSYVVVLAGQHSQVQTRATNQSLASTYDVKVRDQYDATRSRGGSSATPAS